MEVVFLEDPCCSWCWAFQPVETALLFEFEKVRPRRVMGGLRDYPIADEEFLLEQWRLAEQVSGMPFDSFGIREHILQTTFVACRAVKAAHMAHAEIAVRFLRRLREALYVERRPIDDLEVVMGLACEVGLDPGRLNDHLQSGRADALFQRDREEASRHGFGYPTILIRASGLEEPVLLQGIVPYSEVARTFLSVGVPARHRRRFQDRPDDWQRLFQLRPRITWPELRLVTRLDDACLERRLREVGAVREGAFYTARKASWSRQGARAAAVAAAALAK